MSDPSQTTPGAHEAISGAPVSEGPGFANYQNQIYGTFTATPYPILYNELERAARKKLPSSNFNYVFGSAGSEATAKANTDAFKSYEIVPNMLVDSNKRSLEVNLFGEKHKSPILLAPVGVQGIVHPDAEIATAKAAQEVGVGMILSSAATRSIEKVAEANGDGHRWYQLYWPATDAVTVSLLNRAKAAGYTALVVTLDTIQLGWRPRDLQAAYLPFLNGEGLQVLFSDPVWMKLQGEDHTDTKWNGPGEHPVGVEGQIRDESAKDDFLQMSMKTLGEMSSGRFRTWEELAFIRKHWSGPLVVKGIQSVKDAEKAVDVGLDGIIVSNHGGRQVDGAVGSLHCLDQITRSSKVKNSKLTILFDSGIRTGSDIVKALALGAHAVLIARPYMWGLTLGGQEGVEHVIRSLLADLELTMGLSGKPTIKDLDRSMLSYTHAHQRTNGKL